MAKPNQNQNADTTNADEAEETGADTQQDVAAIVNAAVTSQLKRAMKQVTEDLNKTLADQVGKTLAAALPKALESLQPKEADKSKAPATPDPQLVALQEQVEKLTNENRTSSERAAAAEKKARDDRTLAQLQASLTGKVIPGLLPMLTKHLFDTSVTFDDEGNPLFKGKKAAYKGGPLEDVNFTLADGVADFLKQPDAAVYIPAPSGAGGSKGTTPAGTRPANGAAPLPTGDSEDAKIARSIALEEQLKGLVPA